MALLVVAFLEVVFLEVQTIYIPRVTTSDDDNSRMLSSPLGRVIPKYSLAPPWVNFRPFEKYSDDPRASSVQHDFPNQPVRSINTRYVRQPTPPPPPAPPSERCLTTEYWYMNTGYTEQYSREPNGPWWPDMLRCRRERGQELDLDLVAVGLGWDCRAEFLRGVDSQLAWEGYRNGF
ncbi:hypothetical protein BJ875DRAFT_156258 [Amylocarpus encephaloides]|uniref:Uncharacterized protein n=1 Tax=Amylocarpus encephaloides TaxID=45428 RepID=A0A9P7YQR2_9HELO|nr:hypothetical protein BJ875DRAFT_156258 [Amylocarpus encephaloides]